MRSRAPCKPGPAGDSGESLVKQDGSSSLEMRAHANFDEIDPVHRPPGPAQSRRHDAKSEGQGKERKELWRHIATSYDSLGREIGSPAGVMWAPLLR